jgi:hypothetical protein
MERDIIEGPIALALTLFAVALNGFLMLLGGLVSGRKA